MPTRRRVRKKIETMEQKTKGGGKKRNTNENTKKGRNKETQTSLSVYFSPEDGQTKFENKERKVIEERAICKAPKKKRKKRLSRTA